MKIVHISDTHLGFKAYSYTDKETGLNQRELDNYLCFEEAVGKIIKLKPALVLHTGDLFDSVRPSNFTLDFAIEQFKRLTSAGIKVVLLAGNHSTPKVKDQSHVFKIFRHFSGIFPLYKGQYESLEIEGLRIQAVSQSINEEVFQKEVNKIGKLKLPANKFNVLMLHGAFKALKEFSMNEFNELTINPSVLKKNFSYIALGHYHNQTSVSPNCFYSGSLMPLTFNETKGKKGFLLIDLKAKKIEAVKISSRPLIDLAPIQAASLTPEQLEKRLILNLKNAPQGSICRQKVNDIDEDTFAVLDIQSIKKKAGPCLHYQLTLTRQEEAENKLLPKAIGGLQEEFIHFLKRRNLKQDYDSIKEIGLAYLNKTHEIT